MDQKKIGLFLKELRKQKGITQEELAEHLNMSSRSVSRWETGSNMPDISLLSEIADFYDVDIREIIEGERKSGMNEELREVADKMADYAGAEKSRLFKLVMVIGLTGTVLLTVAIVLQCIVYEPDILRFGAIVLSFLGLMSLAVTTLYANGILRKLIGKKAFTNIVLATVIVLLVATVRSVFMSGIIIGLAFMEDKQPYETLTGIENYDKAHLLEQYGSDLDSGLFVFPDDTSRILAAEYRSTFRTGLFDTDGSILLIATYLPDEFERETNRLSEITCTVFKTEKADGEQYTGMIRYDSGSYRYPAYIASDGYSHVFEYALTDRDNYRIIYVYLSYPGVTGDASGTVPTDYLKKDPNEYDLSNSSVNERFSIYSHSFSKGVWSEHSS